MRGGARQCARGAAPHLIDQADYPASMLAEKYELPENVPVLSKPFMPADLLKEIRHLAGTG